jgi:hypothetical protein
MQFNYFPFLQKIWEAKPKKNQQTVTVVNNEKFYSILILEEKFIGRP